MRTGWRSALGPAIALLLVLGAWEAYCRIAGVPAYILPAPSRVLATVVTDWPVLGPALWVTLRIALGALAAAVLGGGLLAILFAEARWAERTLYPYAVVIQVTPVIAIAPLLVIYIQSTAVVLLVSAFVVAFFPVLSNTAQGLKSVDPGLDDLFTLYRASRRQRLLRLKIPGALPYFAAGLRIAGGLSLIGAVVAEFAAGSAGAGAGLAFRMLEASRRLNAPRLFAALLLLVLAGVAFFLVTGLIARLMLARWHESAVPRER